MTESTALVGSWHKVGSPECARKYPDHLTFSAGTFRGTRGETQGFVWWDAGSYRLESDTRLVLTTATDALVAYEVSVGPDELAITDPDGCQFSYRRAPLTG